MGWVRRHRLVWAWAALLALFIELGTGFAHVHAPSENTAISSGYDAQTPQDGDHDHHGRPDFCAICAVLGFLAHGKAPDTPALSPLSVSSNSVFNLIATAPRAPQGRTAFRSRAPPQA